MNTDLPEKYPKHITVEGSVFELVDVQRGGSAIYKNENYYLRIGDLPKLGEDLTLHKRMESFGFPVAQLVSEGNFQNMPYFIEESLGTECFGQIFKKETQTFGQVTDESFGKFLAITAQFATAQLKTVSETKNWETFRTGLHLDILCQELPLLKQKIIDKYSQVEERLKAFPFGILHGDFTPFNIYPKGIIDLEDSFLGPVGFDVGAFPGIQNWFPDTSDDELHKVYKCTNSQTQEYLRTMDNIYQGEGLPKISDFLDEFNFTKGIWFTVRMQHLPSLQQFRYELMESLI